MANTGSKFVINTCFLFGVTFDAVDVKLLLRLARQDNLLVSSFSLEGRVRLGAYRSLILRSKRALLGRFFSCRFDG